MSENKAFDIMHGEERRMEIQDVKSAQRDEKIGVLTKEYYKDVGTFFEWIQSIEIDDIKAYENLFYQITEKEFTDYCEEKATEEIDDE
jgi:hypothetical protein